MLNLKELEAKLDDALSKETKNSLLQWLLNKRLKGFYFQAESNSEKFITSGVSTKVRLRNTESTFIQTGEGSLSPDPHSDYTLAA